MSDSGMRKATTTTNENELRPKKRRAIMKSIMSFTALSPWIVDVVCDVIEGRSCLSWFVIALAAITVVVMVFVAVDVAVVVVGGGLILFCRFVVQTHCGRLIILDYEWCQRPHINDDNFDDEEIYLLLFFLLFVVCYSFLLLHSV